MFLCGNVVGMLALSLFVTKNSGCGNNNSLSQRDQPNVPTRIRIIGDLVRVRFRCIT